MKSDYNGMRTYVAEIGKVPRLTEEETKGLLARYKNDGDFTAREKVATANLRLVLKLAQAYIGMGMDFEDLVQVGNEGLLCAIDKYDVEKGGKFSLYAAHWIKHFMRRYGLDKNKLVRTGDYARNKDRQNTFVSIDEPIDDADGNSNKFSDIIPDDNARSPMETAVVNDGIMVMMEMARSVLTDIERQVLLARYGVGTDNGKAMGVVELGMKCNCTHQQICNIEKRAMQKMQQAMAHKP